MSPPSTPYLAVHREGAAWRWAYVVPSSDGGPAQLRLPASIAFTDVDEARAAARTAYPGTAVVVDGAAPASAAPAHPRRRHRLRLALTGGLAVGLLVLVIRRDALTSDVVTRATQRLPSRRGGVVQPVVLQEPACRRRADRCGRRLRRAPLPR